MIEGAITMMTVTAFFQNLEEKCCSVCGESIVEQAECYMTECFQCHDKLVNQASLEA
jgi:hypothetical protein